MINKSKLLEWLKQLHQEHIENSYIQSAADIGGVMTAIESGEFDAHEEYKQALEFIADRENCWADLPEVASKVLRHRDDQTKAN